MKASHWLRSIKTYLLCLLLFLPPLIFLPFWRNTFTFSKFLIQFAIGGLIFILAGIFFTRVKKIIIFPKLAILFFIPLLVSTAFSTHFLTSLLPQSTMYPHNLFHLVFLLFLAVIFFNWLQKKRLSKLTCLVTYLSTSNLLMSVYALIQLTWHREELFSSYRSRGTIGEPNRLGLYLVATLPVVSSLLFNKNRGLKILGALATTTTLLITLTTMSRGAWLGLAGGLILFFFIKFKTVIVFLKKVSLKTLTLLSLLVIIIAFSPAGQTAFQRLWVVKKDLNNQTGSISLRLAEWQETYQVFTEQPLLRKLIGLGPNTATYPLLSKRQPELNRKRTPNERSWRTFLVRNYYLHLLINTGIIGLLGFIGLITITLVKTITKTSSALDKGVLAGFLIIAVSCLIYYQTVLTSLLFWVYLGILWSRKKLPVFNLRPIFLNLLGLLVLIYTFVYGFSGYLAQRGNFKQATELMPWYDDYWREWSQALIKKGRQLEDENLLNQAQYYAQTAVTLNPLEVENLKVLQSAFYQKGATFDKAYHQQALKLGQQRLKLDPSRAETYNDLGIIYLDLGKLNQAAQYFQQAINVNPDYPPAYLHLGEAYRQLGDFDQAKKYYQSAVERFPYDQVAQNEFYEFLELESQTKP